MIQKFTLESHHDRLLLQGLLVLPVQKPPRAVFQVAHGMCEHKERYLPFLQEMADHGYVCVIHDHRGHGGSVRQTEDLGYFYPDGGPALVSDLYQVTRWIREQYPELPLYLFGHSMGSLAVRCYLKRYPDVPDGVFVCGSPSAAFGLELGERVRAVLAKKKGASYQSKRLADAVFSGFQKPFRDEGRDNAWICSDPAVVDAYNADPLCTFCFTLNGYEALLYLLRTAYSETEWRVTKPELPIRFLSGADDPCRGNDEKFAQAAQLLRQVGYQNVSSRLFPGMRHEILNETEKSLVYHDVLETLDAWQSK